ncbi:unnamed protein product [Microthlaspi erraticum]|uniref:Uncharacterized protein n=1 Tax=Microthlaspi erraticum TaxID=1685480 RepID=A0A6D2IG42_9BRAS|nr:unnamed protein product [Microthlaspi erraticum]
MNTSVTLPTGLGVQIAGIGRIKMSDYMILNNVLYIPDFRLNLLSISQLTKDLGYRISFDHSSCVIQDPIKGLMIAQGEEISNLYVLDVSSLLKTSSLNTSFCTNIVADSALWHNRLGHPSDYKTDFVSDAKVPLEHWGDCILTAVFLINRLPTPLLKNKTPFEILHGKKMDYTGLRVFGCLAFCSTSSKNRTKFQPRARPCVFLGYPSGYKGYKLLDLETNKIHISRHVVFHEEIFPFATAHCESPFDIFSPMDDSSSSSSTTSVDNGVPTVVSGDTPVVVNDEISIEPSTTEESVHSVDKEKKKKRSSKTLAYLQDYFCNMQKVDIPYPLANYLSYDELSDDYKAYICSVNLHAEPSSFTQAKKFEECWVFTSLTLITLLFVRNVNGKYLAVLVYVNDIIITSNCDSEVDQLKEDLKKAFRLRDLGALRYFLGLEIARSKRGISVCQRKYILELLEDTGLLACKPSSFPMDPSVKLVQDSAEPVIENIKLYRRLVGKMMYLTITRPDITYAVTKLCQFASAPKQSHLKAAYKVLHYLKSTIGLGLFYSADSNLVLTGFTDVDWMSCADSRCSTSGYCMFLGNSLISWNLKKQQVVSNSSAESEYHAMEFASREVVWLRGLVEELQAPQSHPVALF